jgi:hypothetical protein
MDKDDKRLFADEHEATMWRQLVLLLAGTGIDQELTILRSDKTLEDYRYRYQNVKNKQD